MDMKTREVTVEAFLAELPQIIEKLETVVITKDGKPYAIFQTLPAGSTMQNWEAMLSTEKDEEPLEIQHVAMSLEAFRADFQNLLEHEERAVLVVREDVPMACFQGCEFRLYLEVEARLEADDWELTPQLEKSLDQAHLRGFTRFLVLPELVQPLELERSGSADEIKVSADQDEDALIEVAEAQRAQLMEQLKNDPVALARYTESLAQARRGEFAHLASLAELRERMGRDKPAVPASPDEVGGSPAQTVAVREATLRELAVEAFLAELPQIIEKLETVIITKDGKPYAIFQTLPAGSTMQDWEHLAGAGGKRQTAPFSWEGFMTLCSLDSDFLLEDVDGALVIGREGEPIACFRGREFRLMQEEMDRLEQSERERFAKYPEALAQLKAELAEARRGPFVPLAEVLKRLDMKRSGEPAVAVSPDEVVGSPEQTAAVREVVERAAGVPAATFEEVFPDSREPAVKESHKNSPSAEELTDHDWLRGR